MCSYLYTLTARAKRYNAWGDASPHTKPRGTILASLEARSSGRFILPLKSLRKQSSRGVLWTARVPGLKRPGLRKRFFTAREAGTTKSMPHAGNRAMKRRTHRHGRKPGP